MGDYDRNLFEKLFKETRPLRKKLVLGIDARRFGVEPEDVMSWFNTKFLFLFQKYHKTQPEYLKGYILRGLSQYRNRICTLAYSEKNLIHKDSFSINTVFDGESLDLPSDETQYSTGMDEQIVLLENFMKAELPHDAYLVFTLELSPPPYITNRLKTPKSRVPSSLIAEYLGWENNEQAAEYVTELRQKIALAKSSARAKFHYLNT
jgi:hypothetical protein